MQPVAQPMPLSELGQRQSASVSLEPVSNINLPPQPTPTVVSSSSGTLGLHTSDAMQPVSDEAFVPVAAETAELASSPSQLRSSKRSTQRTTKTSHKSSSVSDGLCNEIDLPTYIFVVCDTRQYSFSNMRAKAGAKSLIICAATLRDCAYIMSYLI